MTTDPATGRCYCPDLPDPTEKKRDTSDLDVALDATPTSTTASESTADNPGSTSLPSPTTSSTTLSLVAGDLEPGGFCGDLTCGPFEEPIILSNGHCICAVIPPPTRTPTLLVPPPPTHLPPPSCAHKQCLIGTPSLVLGFCVCPLDPQADKRDLVDPDTVKESAGLEQELKRSPSALPKRRRSNRGYGNTGPVPRASRSLPALQTRTSATTPRTATAVV